MSDPWAFRLRFQLARGYRLDARDVGSEDVLERPLSTAQGDFLLLLSGRPQEVQSAVITGSGFSEESAARAAGEMVRVALRAATVEIGLPADLGTDRVTAEMGKSWREALEAEQEIQIRPSVHGLDVFQQHAPVRVFNMSATPTVSVSVGRLVDAFSGAIGRGAYMDARTALAADIFLSAQFEVSARAKVLILVSAMEVLAETEDRPESIRTRVEGLIDLTKAAAKEVEPDQRPEYDSVLNALKSLRQRSIGWAVRRVALDHAPTGKTYLGLPADRFAVQAYNVRSQLTHAGETGEGRDLREFAGQVHFLVRDVLLNILGIPDPPAPTEAE